MKVFLIAGEPSGDKLGASLMEGLRAVRPDVTFEFIGVGGSRMEEQGLSSLFPMDEISVMGVSEILSQYRALKARVVQAAGAVVTARPEVLITIDLPEFCLRVAKLVKSRSDIRTVHYVAPTVWAWRPGRARRMARHIDQVLALLPFEPPYMEAAGMECDFVGHPVVTEPVASEAEAASFRVKHGIGDAPLAVVLPGSRRSEVSRIGPIFGEALQQLALDRPEMRYVLPAAAPVADLVREVSEDWPRAPVLLDGRDTDAQAEKRAAFKAADVALAASGTVSLELAAAGTPMVIGYDMSWLSWQIIPRLMLIDTVTLVNLVSDSRTVPEFIGPDCKADNIARAVLETADNPRAQAEAMALTMERLGRGQEPPGERAARAVLRHLPV